MKKPGLVTACVIGLAALAVLLVVILVCQPGLHKKDDALRELTGQIAELAAANTSLSNRVVSSANAKTRSNDELLELMRLRSQVGQFLREKQEQLRLAERTNDSRTQAAQTPPAAPQRIPRESWNLVGFDTPGNALESMMWAMKRGDEAALFACLTPEAQRALLDHFAGMSQADISAALQKEISGLEDLRLDRVKNVSDTDATFVLFSSETDNGTTKTRDEAVLHFKNVNGEWKSTGL